MSVHALTPSELETLHLCESRLSACLNHLNEEWNEEQGKDATAGTLARCAAKYWYRPSEIWIKRFRAGEDFDLLKAQADQLRHAATDSVRSLLDGQDAKRNEALRAALDIAEIEIMAQGLEKHPMTNAARCFEMAIAECSRSEHFPTALLSGENPMRFAVLTEARALFNAIIAWYDRDQLNIVFAARRYIGKLADGVNVDLIVDLGIDRGCGHLEVINFRTELNVPPKDELQGKDLVFLNLLVVRGEPLRYPNKSFTSFCVRSGIEVGPIGVTSEQLDDYALYLAAKYERVSGLAHPGDETEGRPVAMETTNRHCNNCRQRFCCKAYLSLLGGVPDGDHPLTGHEKIPMDVKSAMAEYEKLKSQISLLENSKSQLSKAIIKMCAVKKIDSACVPAVDKRCEKVLEMTRK